MKIFSVQELKPHLSNDTPEDELMRIYGLSHKQLKDLHDQLRLAMVYGSPYIQIDNDNNWFLAKNSRVTRTPSGAAA